MGSPAAAAPRVAAVRKMPKKKTVTFDNTPTLVLIVGDERDAFTFNNVNKDGTPRVSQTDYKRRKVRRTPRCPITAEILVLRARCRF